VQLGSIFLYKLLGVSSLIGLLVSCIFLPLNHFAGKVVVKAQDGLMESRDERVALMNEILGAIRMLKFMAWERSFEKKAMKVRAKELRFQRMNYLIETVFSAIWEGSPLLVTLISFWHFAVWRNQTLSPSIAFTSISVFNEMRFALNALPETFINMLQSLVSLRRIERYLQGAEITPVPSLDSSSQLISMTSATLSWPQARSVSVPSASESAASSATSTPARKFMLVDISAEFPAGELSLICGKLGAGKTLFLLSLLGEADVLTGQVLCPRSPPDSLAAFATDTFTSEDWIVPGLAYVPQAAWLRNASIKDNILFSLPYNEERYRKTLEVTALLNDLEVLEDGDESEIGERGVNLSGGQKARVSLARAVYSRASVLLLDDVLSAVDAHTAQHLYTECLKGDLMRGRTVILVSHHVALCAPGAAYVVALDNGRLSFAGPSSEFLGSAVMETLVQSKTQEAEDPEDPEAIADEKAEPGPSSETASTITAVANDSNQTKDKKKGPRKLVEEEKRAVGRVSANIWMTYIKAVGTAPYWLIFVVLHLLGAVVPVVENSWLRCGFLHMKG
jgi:ABC-type multidrug transport system fused ATPase/permease subunit